PNWFISAQKTFVEQVSLGAGWLECVAVWGRIEERLGYGLKTGAKTGLSAQGRPMEWQKWTSKHKSPSGDRPFHLFPPISNASDLGLAIVKWWNRLQPAFRCNSEVTNILEPPIPKPMYTPPTDVNDTWGSLSRAGPNGLASLVTLLMWW
ncbi:hypothetical protein BJ165DRAFT_1333056, partial [Panaeolus papilionaceus]